MAIDVVTAFMVSKGNVLLGKRSTDVGTYSGCWGGISGYREHNGPRRQVLREIREETGLTAENLNLERTGNPLDVDDHENQLYWRVFPFRFSLVGDREPEPLEEHDRLKWFNPEKIPQLQAFPKLKQAWHHVQ